MSEHTHTLVAGAHFQKVADPNDPKGRKRSVKVVAGQACTPTARELAAFPDRFAPIPGAQAAAAPAPAPAGEDSKAPKRGKGGKG
jgi:hypothetical protein